MFKLPSHILPSKFCSLSIETFFRLSLESLSFRERSLFFILSLLRIELSLDLLLEDLFCAETTNWDKSSNWDLFVLKLLTFLMRTPFFFSLIGDESLFILENGWLISLFNFLYKNFSIDPACLIHVSNNILP